MSNDKGKTEGEFEGSWQEHRLRVSDVLLVGHIEQKDGNEFEDQRQKAEG